MHNNVLNKICSDISDEVTFTFLLFLGLSETMMSVDTFCVIHYCYRQRTSTIKRCHKIFNA